jgi:DNA repair exonuclease SbcCD ATPase subunit
MKKIRARNFMCYGNNWVEFEIREGITQILGENGNGKSTIFEIMYFVMFNAPFRPKITKADLLNDQNMKQLETEMTFDVIENDITDSYIISRGMKPDYFKIIKNGVELNSASSALNQEVLKTVITSISEGVFISSVGLSPITAKPIIEMSPEDRRSASSEMFSMKDIDVYRNKIKEKVSANRVDETMIVAKLQTLHASIMSLKIAIDEHKKNNEQAIAEKRIQLEIKEREYSVIYDEYVGLKCDYEAKANDYALLVANKSGADKNIISNAISERNGVLSTNKLKKAQLESKIKTIIPGEVCSQCREELSIKSAEAHINEINQEIISVSTNISDIEAEISTKRVAYEAAFSEATIIDNAEKIRDRAFALMNTSGSILNERNAAIVEIRTDIENMCNRLKNSDDRAGEELARAENEYRTESSRLATIRSSNEIDVNLSKVFADDGLKAYVISNYMTNFNNAVNRYLGIIGLPISITFNEKFDHVMKSGVGIGKKYYSLSTGQRQRLNLAIALSVVDLTMAIGRLKCNVLFLDEIADIAMDDSGMSAFLGIINSISRRDNKAIILISHKNMDMIKGSKDLINYAYEAVRVDGNFSSLVEVKGRGRG